MACIDPDHFDRPDFMRWNSDPRELEPDGSIKRVERPCLINGSLHVPTGWPVANLYWLAVHLGMDPEVAAKRYYKRKDQDDSI